MTLFKRILLAFALLAPSVALADPGPPVEEETCAFLPDEERMALPPDHPCYLPPPPYPEACQEPGGQMYICP